MAEVNSVGISEPELCIYGGVMLGKTPLPGPRAKAVILALAMAHGRPLSATSLIDDVWGMDAPASATTALHTMVSRIRTSQWHGLITSTDAGYALGVAPDKIDYWAAESLLASARTTLAQPEQALEFLNRAASLASGDAAAGTASSPILDDFQQRAGRQRAAIARLQAQALAANGDHGAAAEHLEALVAADPLDEALQLEHLTALHAGGQTAAALQAYEAFRRRLRNDLGADPGPALARLHAQLLAPPSDAGHPLTAGAAPSDNAGVRPNRHLFGLKASPNTLLGRDADIAGVESLMASGRLTTILGIGGLGKTRMALELANRSAEQGTPSVLVVELAGTRTSEDLWLTLADAAGIQEARAMRTIQDRRPVADLRSRTLSRLAGPSTLLVMDNCEHLIDHAAAAIADVLALCPGVSVLATSRAPLNIAGERLHQLQPLATEGGDGSRVPAAVELFRERALAARPGATLEDAVVGRLCLHLDGLPLAIELAAARVRLMSVEDIERRLARRFELLVNTDRSAPARHRTLTAVIDWSWELLGAAEQAVARRLARFPSGFTLPAAIATAGTVPDGSGKTPPAATVEAGVEALLNQSLVLAREDPATGQLRFRMLETVREFAALKLAETAETAAVDQSMSGWAAQFSLAALANSSGAGQLETLAQVGAEQENLLHVLRGALDGNGTASTVYSIFGMLANYWSQRGMHGEVFTMAAPVLAATKNYEPDPETIDAAVFSLSVIGITTMIFSLRKGVEARVRLGRVVRSGLPMSPRTDAMARLMLAAGNEEKVVALMARLRQDPDGEVAAMAFLLSGLWAENDGRPEEATAFAERAFQLAEAMHDTWAAGSAADNAAQLHSQNGRPAEAVVWGERAIERLTLVGAAPDVRAATVHLAFNHASLGRPDEAAATLERLKTMPPAGEFQGDVLMMETAAFAETAFAAGNPSEGLRLYRSLGRTSSARRNEGPAGLVLAASQIGAELLFNADALEDPLHNRAVRQLRHAAMGMMRSSPTLVDKPVVGTAALAVGSWHALVADPGTRRAAVGLELLAMAEALASRQDEGVLRRGRHEALAVERHGLAALEQAKRSVAGPVDDKPTATERVLRLFSDPSLRGI